MGIFNFFKSLVDSETLGDEIIRSQEKAYNNVQKLYPDADQHDLLALVWLSRIAPSKYLNAISGKNTNIDEELQTVAFSETMLFACIQPPGNVRVLGLYFIYKECPFIIEKYPKFSREFIELMSPVFAAMKDGSIEGLYKKFNKSLKSNLPDFDRKNRGTLPVFPKPANTKKTN